MIVRQHRLLQGLLLACALLLCRGASPTASVTTSVVSVATKRPPPPPPALGANNPLWPGGISDADVDRLVKEILKDPTINIASIPDALEKQIYRSTVKVVLNAIYRSLAQIDGKPLPAGHELHVGRSKGKHLSQKRIQEHYLSVMQDDTDDAVLEEVADRLLSNQNINQRFLPDAIERKLYTNCLKLVFRLLGMIAASFKLSVCGHELRVSLSKADSTVIQRAAVERAAISMSAIDAATMDRLTREAGLETKGGWFFGRKKQELMRKLNASLFGLILSIVDDLLANTKIELLSDRVYFDIVPCENYDNGLDETEEATDAFVMVEKDVVVEKDVAVSKQRISRPIMPFVIGVVVGVALLKVLERLALLTLVEQI